MKDLESHVKQKKIKADNTCCSKTCLAFVARYITYYISNGFREIDKVNDRKYQRIFHYGCYIDERKAKTKSREKNFLYVRKPKRLLCS